MEAASNRERTVVLNHGGHSKQTAEQPDSSIGQTVSVKVVHHDAQPTHSPHFSQQLNGFITVEMVQEEGGMGEVEGIVGIGQVKCVGNVELYLVPKERREGSIKPVSTVFNDCWIDIDAGGLDMRVKTPAPSDQVCGDVACSGAEVENVKAGMGSKDGSEDGIRRTTPPEQPVDPTQVSKSCLNVNVFREGIVHPL